MCFPIDATRARGSPGSLISPRSINIIIREESANVGISG